MISKHQKKIFNISLAFYLATFGMVGLSYIGVSLPVIGKGIKFLYLTFIPGFLLLGILKIKNINTMRTVLYSIGLSLALLMIVGLIINYIYPIIGIKHPLSTASLTVTLAFVGFFILMIFRSKEGIERNEIIIPPFSKIALLILIWLPFLSIVGTYLVNFHAMNIVLLIQIILISIIASLVSFNIIKIESYGVIIYAISLSLLLDQTLISMNLFGSDIFRESYYINIVKSNMSWDPKIDSNLNAMLSLVMLGPIYSKILGISTTWTLKLVYPLIFSFVPVGLYELYRKQTNNKTAFLATFFFMSFWVFFSEMLQLARQEIAELFFVLILLLIIDNEKNQINTKLILIIFALSLVVSHYGLSYIFILLLISSYILLKCNNKEISFKLYKIFHEIHVHLKNNNIIKRDCNLPVRTTSNFWYFMLVFAVMALSWYIYTSSSSIFISVINIGNHILNSVFTDFLSESYSVRLVIGAAPLQIPSIWRHIKLWLFHITQFLIVVGVIGLFTGYKKSNFNTNFRVLSYSSLFLMFISIITPRFAASLNMTRIYHIALFFLSPFCILGAEFLTGFLNSSLYSNRLKQKPHINTDKLYAIFTTLILVPYFLFNTGFVYEITGDVPTSYFLSFDRFKTTNFNETKIGFYGAYAMEKDVKSAKWIKEHKARKYRVYADIFGSRNILYCCAMLKGDEQIGWMSRNKIIKDNSYIFLRYFNMKENYLVLNARRSNNTISLISVDEFISKNIGVVNKIYSNGAEVYLKLQ